MGLEAASWITDLVSTNPVGATDKKSQGDDHIRLIKAVLQACFPVASKAFYFPQTSSKSANFTIVAADNNKTFLVDPTAGAVTATLPTLVGGDGGWECHFIKATNSVNPLFIVPASGTVQSGEIPALTKCRRAIPYHRFSARWSGGVWFVDRIPRVPAGSVLDFIGATVPVGYEFAYGQTLTSSSVDYQEYYNAIGGSGTVPDYRGRVGAGQDDMGGTSANRLTFAVTGGLNGDSLGNVGGSEINTLGLAELPAVTINGSTNPTALSPLPTFTDRSGSINVDVGSSATVRSGSLTPIALDAYTIQALAFSTPLGGGGAAHNNVQPTIITNKIVVVE